MAGERDCDVCGARMKTRDRWTWRCPDCHFMASNLAAGGGTGVAGLEALRRQNYETILDRLAVQRPLRGLRLLEVGSAWGWFLQAAEARGMIARGIEPEAANVHLATQEHLAVDHGLFPQDLTDRGPYDLIVFNDVFEHLPNPVAMLAVTEVLLASDGMVVINLPSSRGVMFRVARLLDRGGVHGPHERLWQRGFESPHVSYFAPRNLELLATRHTALTVTDQFALPAVSRRGLRARVRASHRGPVGLGLLATVWLASFLLRWLPSDIEVMVLRSAAHADGA